MRQTPLLDEHKALGGKVIDFSGWALPVQFAGILQEHRHTRSRASIFDCSHMGEFRIQGREAIEAYDALITTDTGRIRPGRARYGALLTEDGGYMDDLITMRLGDDELFVVTNAGSLDRVSAVFAVQVPGLVDESAETAKIDIQGPLSREILVSIGLTAAAALSYFGLAQTEWAGYPVLLSRTGYTGELGYELYLPNAAAVPLWRRLLDHPAVAPAGLGARDTLRLEMGYLLSGQDIDESRTPLEARQDAFIDWHKPFTGRDALQKRRDAGGYAVLTPIRTDSRSAPRHGFDVYRGDETVGVVTSGTYGPSVERGIGLAYLPPELAEPGVALTAGPRQMAIEVTEIPFYGAGTCRN